MDLSCSQNLVRTPDFSGVPNLEELRLSYCGRLVEIHPSTGQLSKLRYLDLQRCYNLTDLPCISAVQSLTFLDLSRCFKLSLFPKFTGIMKSLSTLNLAWTAMKKAEPSSIECLPALTFLDLSHCTILECLLSNMDNLKYLKYMDLSCSPNLIRTPDFSSVPILEELGLSNCCRLVEIHPSIGQLKKLRYLRLSWCTSLTNLPSMSAEMMQSLMGLDLSRCYKISSIPKFTGTMKSLSELNLSWTAIEKVEPSSIECLTALAFLDLSHCTRLECLPSNMDNLWSLETLDLSQCSKLKLLPRLPSNVRCIKPEGFSFLNFSPEGVKLSIWSQSLSQWLPFDESGSLVGFTKLFHFLRGLFYHKAVLGGYIIRSWSAVKAGFSINIKLPANWYNSKWIGFALWASLPRAVEVKVKNGIRARVITLGVWERDASSDYGYVQLKLLNRTYMGGMWGQFYIQARCGPCG
nr:disease resistance protein TAO1-like [Quercus suber]